MPKELNKPIGEYECQYKGCAEKISVFRYRERSGDPKNRRFGGKLYARCPRHGLIHDNDGLLEGANIWGANEAPAAAAAPVQEKTAAAVPPQKTPAKVPPAPEPKSTPPAPAPEKSKGGLFL